MDLRLAAIASSGELVLHGLATRQLSIRHKNQRQQRSGLVRTGIPLPRSLVFLNGPRIFRRSARSISGFMLIDLPIFGDERMIYNPKSDDQLQRFNDQL